MQHTVMDASVMLVDDEVPFVEAMTRRLGRRNIEIRTAHSGEEALAGLEDDPSTEVVILDVKMPGMGGMATLVEIKRRNPFMEVILLTGHATLSAAMDGIRNGAFDFLMKPCDIDDLVAKVNAAAKKKHERESQLMEAKMMALISRDA